MQFIKNLWKSFTQNTTNTKNMCEMELVLSHKFDVSDNSNDQHPNKCDEESAFRYIAQNALEKDVPEQILLDQAKEWKIMLKQPISSTNGSTDQNTLEKTYHTHYTFKESYFQSTTESKDLFEQTKEGYTIESNNLFEQPKENHTISITAQETLMYNPDKTEICDQIIIFVSSRKWSFKNVRLRSYVLTNNLKPNTSLIQNLFPATNWYLTIPRVKLKQKIFN
jgi:hypothetical protein